MRAQSSPSRRRLYRRAAGARPALKGGTHRREAPVGLLVADRLRHLAQPNEDLIGSDGKEK
eukprot:2105259-Pyramimonas_sp.AAC.1